MSYPLPAKSPSLHPVLQVALGSLDVQLEAELTQYRCHQAVRRLSPLARQACQNQISKLSNETLWEATESTATAQYLENTHPICNNPISNSEIFSNSDSAPISSNSQGISLPELISSPLTLETYLEFSKTRLEDLGETKASAQSRSLQSFFKLSVSAAVISLLLSIPLSYVIINHPISHSPWNQLGNLLNN